MKPGLSVGETYAFSLTVSEAMKGTLLDHPIHELYGTAAMIAHMEWAARQHILPYLEEGEEGVGHHINVRHLHPTPVGAEVRITSTVSEVGPRRVKSHVAAWWGEIRIGAGEVEQALVEKAILYQRAGIV